jgi:hypothetical protein
MKVRLFIIIAFLGSHLASQVPMLFFLGGNAVQKGNLPIIGPMSTRSRHSSTAVSMFALDDILHETTAWVALAYWSVAPFYVANELSSHRCIKYHYLMMRRKNKF